MSIIVAAYSILTISVIVLAFAMPYRYRDQQVTAVTAVSLLGVGCYISLFVTKQPEVSHVPLYLFLDLFIAMIGTLSYLRRPKNWTLVLTVSTLLVMLLDMMSPHARINQIWALFNNGLYLTQLGSIAWAALTFWGSRKLASRYAKSHFVKRTGGIL